MPLTDEQLRDIVAELVSRPGHEKVRVLVHRLLVEGLGAPSTEVQFERPIPEVRGRLDALLGQTVFEFKRDLRAERQEAETQLQRYLSQREAETKLRYVGIAIDGAEFAPYELRAGKLAPLQSYRPAKDNPRELLVWLDTVVNVRPELPADPDTVRAELGRSSVAYERAYARLSELWEAVRDHPEVQVKRRLWGNFLAMVYGSHIEGDDLFLQHTYLTIVAKTMATSVLDVQFTSPAELLSGKPLADIGVHGAVESDFFDWVLEAPGSEDLIMRIARQVARFRLQAVEHDVLKGLYESLIDPDQRHDLGEYYTPDWLAARVCDRAIDRPLEQRVLDPACGSGTFLFHAVRRFLAAAEATGLPNREGLARCTKQVLGVDVHPVAVLIARATYLMAIGQERLRGDRTELSIPVYLGDSLQWNTRGMLVERDVLIEVPDGPVLHFPASVAGDPGRFDRTVDAMLQYSEMVASPDALAAWLAREVQAEPKEVATLTETYRVLHELRRGGRDHIWGYVARNLSRPIWLSSTGQKADVVVGNPPWLSYRYMARKMQEQFRQECQERGLWAGGKVATHQDLSAYFFARCVELYLQPGGRIAFVMPYAALNRQQFRGFRRGWFGRHGRRHAAPPLASVRFEEAWAFDERVQPLFPVPACVLFARRDEPAKLPETVRAYRGTLPRRDASPAEADAALQEEVVPWPPEAEAEEGSPYRERFRQGATMVPRKLCVVERVDTGWLGGNPAAPLVKSRRTRQEKPPWRDLSPLRGPVEAVFLRPLYLGESVAPFRLLTPVLAVVPWDPTAGRLLDAADAQLAGYPHLARWLQTAEGLWADHGQPGMTLVEWFDYYRKLSAQFPVPTIRVLYAASGTLPAAAITRDERAVIEHGLYWAPTDDELEARYLIAVLNSHTLRQRIATMQAKGQWGARHFDKLPFAVLIPKFNGGDALHRDLAAAAEHAEQVAAAVALPQGLHFVRARQRIRDALQTNGIAGHIDALVARLIGA
jgi:SAM-dependent methyltransferase